MRGLRVALSFLTRIPTSFEETNDSDMRLASAWFPIVGAVVGLMIGGGYALASQFLPSLLSAAVAIGLGILVTGGFHEDGLADTADSFGSGTTGQRALEIMRDPRVGTFGAIALIFSVIWRVAALGSLGPTLGVVGLVVSHSLSRAGAIVLAGLCPPARHEGLGRSMVSGASRSGVVLAGGIALVMGGALSGLWIIPASIAVTLTVAWFRRSALRKLGGVTGDVLGATQQTGEMSVLAVFAAASWKGATVWWL